ncbi:hypothetical protein AGMMS49579_02660 [Spirochaetia bacterium]|nr:hypothetical protein AGMMS49579_02660 [Spirochaetia bacterium]
MCINESNQQGNTRFDYIDVLRGIAILGVVAVHTCQYGTFDMPKISLITLLGNGASGVQLFYLASAFTLFLSLKTRIGVEHQPIKYFFIRRFFRIAPMYYIAIIVYLVLDGFGPRYWLGDAKGISIANIVSNVLFLHGFNPYWITSLVPGGWSVAVEMMFYAILPLLFKNIKNINHALCLFFVSIVFKHFLAEILSNFDPTTSDRLWGNYLFLYLPSQLPVFVLEIILDLFANYIKPEVQS